MTNSENTTDKDLILAVRADNGQAYAVLVDRHLPSVYSVALRIVGNQTDAEDIAQDTFVRAFERLEQYDIARKFKNWLLKIASNLAITFLRSRKRRDKLNEKMIETDPGYVPSSEPDSFSREELNYWLDQIDETQRSAIVLFHFEEMSYVEVSEALQLPLNTVRTLLYRGRKRLRELMTRRGGPAYHDRVENDSCNVEKRTG